MTHWSRFTSSSESPSLRVSESPSLRVSEQSSLFARRVNFSHSSLLFFSKAILFLAVILSSIITLPAYSCDEDENEYFRDWCGNSSSGDYYCGDGFSRVCEYNAPRYEYSRYYGSAGSIDRTLPEGSCAKSCNHSEKLSNPDDVQNGFIKDCVSNSGVVVPYPDLPQEGWRQRIVCILYSPKDGFIPPQANFTYTPSEGNAPLTVFVDASGSTDSDGSITDYQWSASTLSC